MSEGFRHFILGAVAAYSILNLFKKDLWPWGHAGPLLEHERPSFSDIDMENDGLQAKYGRLSKIYERIPEGREALMKGPESVLFDHEGIMYVLTEEGQLVSLTDFKSEEPDISPLTSDPIATVSAQGTLIKDLGPGRPLGGTFQFDASTNQTTLYVADTLLGLIRVRDVHDPTSIVELVASRVQEDDGTWSPILYANTVAIGPKTGMIYFTDSSDIAPKRVGTRTWDTLTAALLDLWRGKKTGRLLQYNPKTDQVSVLARGFAYSNGIEIDANEEYLVMVETWSMRIWKVSLPTGSLEVLADSLPGYPDNVGCDHTGDADASNKKSMTCYAAMLFGVYPIAKFMAKLPHPIDQFMRSVLMILPTSMQPPFVRYGGVVRMEIGGDADLQKQPKASYSLLQDPSGHDISMITSVAVNRNKLYFGSLKNKFIGVYDMHG